MAGEFDYSIFTDYNSPAYFFKENRHINLKVFYLGIS